jgi:hypothetical protein
LRGRAQVWFTGAAVALVWAVGILALDGALQTAFAAVMAVGILVLGSRSERGQQARRESRAEVVRLVLIVAAAVILPDLLFEDGDARLAAVAPCPVAMAMLLDVRTPLVRRTGPGLR